MGGGLKNRSVPVWLRTLLTLEEAAEYTGMTTYRLRELTNDHSCEFVVWIGTKRLIKRRLLEEYLDKLEAEAEKEEENGEAADNHKGKVRQPASSASYWREPTQKRHL